MDSSFFFSTYRVFYWCLEMPQWRVIHWNTGSMSGATDEENWLSYPRQPPIVPQLGVVFNKSLCHPCWYLGYCFTIVIDYFWVLEFFCSLFHDGCWELGDRECHRCPTLGWELSSLVFFTHWPVVSLRISHHLLQKKKLLWWWLTATLINGYTDTYVGAIYSMSS